MAAKNVFFSNINYYEIFVEKDKEFDSQRF